MNENDITNQPPPAKRPFQFSLQWLFAVTTFIALAAGLTVWLGPGGALLSWLLLLAIAVYRRSWDLLSSLIIIGVVGLCLFPALKGSRGRSPGFQCLCNLKQLGYALQGYESDYGSFPPAYIADKNGKPMHSWRVLILPYLEKKDLYKRYRFDEPWNGPNNRKLEKEMPKEFRCPNQPAGRHPYATSYVAVVGSNTVWRHNRSVKVREIKDGTSHTVLLVEIADSGIHWMEPRDLEYPPMPTKVNPASGQGISNHHSGVANAALVDGSISTLSEELQPEKIKALLSIDGGEPVSGEDF
jgi:hypothetical protein